MTDPSVKMMQKTKMLPRSLLMESVSPATRLLEKRRQMFEVQEALEAHKIEFERKEEMLKMREENLKKKDLELQESLIRFSIFLQENDAKHARAEKKIAEEIKMRKEKENEIELLRKQLEHLEKEKEDLNKTFEKNQKYQNYLENVLEEDDTYQEIGEIIRRYETLKLTNQDLKENQKLIENQIENHKLDSQKYLEETTEKILNLNNYLSKLKRELEIYESDKIDSERKRNYNMQVLSQKELEYGQIILSTDNLVNKCFENSKIQRATPSNVFQQLDLIGNFVSDLKYIVSQKNI